MRTKPRVRPPSAITPIYLARQKLKMTQTEAAERVGIGIRHYRYVEQWLKVPSVLVALRIARMFNSDVWELWGDLEDEDWKASQK